ncbi:hypothetical protein H7E67_14800 [Clostridium gasigenes]|uniref:hypothetical protein n=1 Tax=Clostridium gasigenes TaxID=94869 RepID=UPI001626B95C|nr:hypothetical protein [Clostridium gasigenes]MBB6624707.1 hypothetical protein [Clostridium gasigenes]MBU3087303.1 hypothetical protein [Clostridium gasigenes]
MRMFKKIMDFQRVLYFPNNFDATDSIKHIGKIFLLYVLVNVVYSSIMGINTNIINIFFMSTFFLYTRINKKIRLWELVPVSNKFAISNIFFNFYYFIFMMMLMGSGVAIVSLSFIRIFWGGNSSTFLEARNGAFAYIGYFSKITSIIGILIFFIMANVSITIFFIRNIKYRLASLGSLFGIPLILAYIFKITYNKKIFDALVSIENINLNYILLGISSILFILSLFGGIKIALNLHKKIVINE